MDRNEEIGALGVWCTAAEGGGLDDGCECHEGSEAVVNHFECNLEERSR